MGQLEDMALFVRVVDAGGISKAAEQANIAKSAVSRRLKALETSLNTQLINRTTRNSTLTDAGRHYYEHACEILNKVEVLNENTSGVRSKLNGTLKMTAPLSFGLIHLSSIIDQFARQNPELSFKLDFSDRKVDLIEEGYELAIRIGELADSSYQAKRLVTINYILCASPDYIKEQGEPKNLAELATHTFLQYGLGKEIPLTLTDAENKKQIMTMQAQISANNGDFLIEMAKKDHGIVYLPTFLAHRSLMDGTLIPLMRNYSLPWVNAYAVYPKNRFLSQRCRTFINYLTTTYGKEPYWDKEIRKKWPN